MSSSADVRSLAALKVFQEHCRKTRENLLKELENLQIEIRRLTSWIENDADRYWCSELQQAERYWAECQEALLRCESYVRASEQKPCTEQRKRLEKATQRRNFCQQQVRLVKDAKLAWQQGFAKTSSKIFHCRDLAETDLTAAIAHLDGRLDLLESYTQLRSGAINSLADSQPGNKGEPAQSSGPEPTLAPEDFE
jgi:hypothetical protein